MEEQQFMITPHTVTLHNQPTKQSTQLATINHSPIETQPKLNKYSSEPKFHSYKDEILKIPKVKQILNKDKFLYNEDIEKRL